MMNFGESNLMLGFLAHQYDLDNLANQIVSEYHKGNTSLSFRLGFDLSKSDMEYVEDKVLKLLGR